MAAGLLLHRAPLLPGAADLVGFGDAQMPERALGVALGRALVAAIAGSGFPAAILGPVPGFVAVVQDSIDEFAAVLGRAHLRF